MSQSVAGRAGGIEGYFQIQERGSSVRTEVVAGITTFMTMAYILFLNPAILSSVPDVDGTTLPPAGLLTVTALAAGLTTIAMGAWANVPFALAAGLGLNGFVAFTLVGAQGLTWPQAMGVIVVEGLVILVLVLTKFRQAVFEAVPAALKASIAVGIGLFIAIIGFVDAGFVTSPLENPPLGLGTNNELRGWPVFIFVIGLLFIIFLYIRKVKGALLFGILGTTILAIFVNEVFLDGVGFGPAAHLQSPVDFPDGANFSLIGDFSFGFFAELGFISAVLAVFTVMLSDFFDTMGTTVGLGREAGLLDDQDRLPNVDRVLLVDSAAAAVGGAFSASSNTTYIETASGIADGARTGLAAVVTGILFLLAIFFSPLAEIIPIQAAAPALVIVGFLMMTHIRSIPWDDLELAIPSFLTMVVMPFTYSITNGIKQGFITYTFIKVTRGKTSEVHPMMWISSAAFVIYFGIFYVRDFLT